MNIKKLKKLNLLLCELQGETYFSDSDKGPIGITILAVRDKINRYKWKNGKKITLFKKCFINKEI